MIKDERQRKYKERLKERGEKTIQFNAHYSFVNNLDDFAKSIRRTRADTIKTILINYLKKHGYDFSEAHLLRKLKKDVL